MQHAFFPIFTAKQGMPSVSSRHSLFCCKLSEVCLIEKEFRRKNIIFSKIVQECHCCLCIICKGLVCAFVNAETAERCEKRECRDQFLFVFDTFLKYSTLF